MAQRLILTANEILYRLGDVDQTVWKIDEIEAYLSEGYDRLAYATEYFFGRSRLREVKGQAVYDLPDEIYTVIRVTRHNKKLTALKARDLLQLDAQYRTTKGLVEAYILDSDGLRKIRLYRIPQDNIHATEKGGFGIPRYNLQDQESSSWGIPRTVPANYQELHVWGIPRFLDQAGGAMLEYTRRGNRLQSDQSKFEFPDLYVKSLRWYAIAKALDRQSPGQDQLLAKHYMARFDEGIRRIKLRISEFRARPARRMGGRRLRRPERRGPVWGPEFPVRG